MTELSFPVSCALVLGKLRERAAEARGQVNEASVLKEGQAGGLAAPSPTPALTSWAGREGARGSSVGPGHSLERKEVPLAGISQELLENLGLRLRYRSPKSPWLH